MADDADQGGVAAGAGRGLTATEGERAPRGQVAERTTVVLRPPAGPPALGFGGLAAATFLLAGLQL